MTTYNGTNMELEQDASGNWVFTNPAQTFIDTNSFPTADPEFQYAPTDTTTEDETTDPCPAGYIYDETLKQCVPDPNYQAPGFLGEPQGGGREDEPEGLHIPSNATKEHWINNPNTVITEGEGASTDKTGLQLYLDNLDDRGFIKKENGKIIFEKDVKGHPIYQGVANILGHQAKVDKIVHDLQRMGAINAEVNLNEKGDMVYTSEMELSDTAFSFPTYNYDTTGKYTGFTTPEGREFKTTGTFGTAGYTSSWENYMNEMAKVKTSVTKPVTQVTQEPIISEDKIAKEKERKAKLEADAAQVELDRKKVEAERDMQETIRKAEKQEPVKKEYRDKGQVTYSTKDTGGYVTTKNIPSAPPRERGGGGYTKPTPKKHERPGTSGAPGYHW